MPEVTIVDVVDAHGFGLIPPCADPGFDHRSCDYWEDADRGSKAARLSWLEGEGGGAATSSGTVAGSTFNPFAPESSGGAPNPFAPPARPDNPFAPPPRQAPPNPFAADADALADNPFAPSRPRRPTVDASAPPKLRLLARGLAVFGSYAKVLLVDAEPAAWTQFGPLSAYPRAQRTRELYPQLPEAPLPAVITCIATTAAARRRGWARRLVEAVCADLASRGFSAVETYPEVGARENATSAATPAFWEGLGFVVAAADDRFPVMRRELG